MNVVIDTSIGWRDVARVADGANLDLSPAGWQRVAHARNLVEALVESGRRAYGITTGVGALSDTVVGRADQSRLSRNIVLSHACGVGPRLGQAEVRAIMTAQIANFAHGYSGVRVDIIRHLLRLIEANCIPDVPSRGSAGYLTHNAHVSLVLIGEGWATLEGRRMAGRDALAAIGLEPLVLQAKEGLSLVNGTACSTGLLALSLARAERLLDWADMIAAVTIEAAGGQMAAFAEPVLALRRSEGIARVGARLRTLLADSGLIAAAAGRRTQDALSLRSVPHAHGATWDVLEEAGRVCDRELASVTDNPVVAGAVEAPEVWSEAHAVAPALGQAADGLAIAMAQIAAMSERRLDRLVNPLVSGLPPFLASDAGSHSGFMIAQYTAAALVNENRRLAAPAATDGGITSALQEDFLAHPTAAAAKLLAVLDNAAQILAIELMAGVQAQDFLTSAPEAPSPASGTRTVRDLVRQSVERYDDDRPLGADMETLRDLIVSISPPGP